MRKFQIGNRVCLSGYSYVDCGEAVRYFGTGTITHVHSNPTVGQGDYIYYVSWDGANLNDGTDFYYNGPYSDKDLELESYQHFLDKIKDRL